MTRAMVRGEEAAWVRFHEEYSGRIYRYLLVLFKGDAEMAGEVLQVTFTRVARHFRQFEDEAVLWGWLTRIARTAAIDEWRKRGTREESLRQYADARNDHESDHESWPELLNRGLAGIRPADSELLRLKYIEGRSVRELAISAGDTEKAMESKLTRARIKLRAALLQMLKDET